MAEKAKRRMIRWVAAAAVLGLSAGIGAVYVMDGGVGNGAACNDTLASAARLDPYRLGDMAAFTPADRAVDLSGLSFHDASGAKMTVADLKGKILLLNFWATWCAPCRAEMPALDALDGEKAGKDFAVVPVNLDLGTTDKPKAFYTEVGIQHLAHYSDNTMSVFNAVKAEGLGIGLPTTLLADRNGCLLGVLHGPAAWDGKEAKALLDRAIAGTAG